MEEYEVELIDYLRVIWKGKWIILICLVVALAAAAAVAFTRPDEYVGKATYRLYETLSFYGVAGVDAHELGFAVEDLDPDLLKDEGIEWEGEVKDNRVTVSLSGRHPEALGAGLDTVIGRIEGALIDRAQRQIAQAIASAEVRIAQNTHVQQALETLLESVAPKSDENPLYVELSSTRVAMEAKIAADQFQLARLHSISAEEKVSLQLVTPFFLSPRGSGRVVGLAVAAVLGLFVGVLFAFFFHYLSSVRERERWQEQRTQ